MTAKAIKSIYDALIERYKYEEGEFMITVYISHCLTISCNGRYFLNWNDGFDGPEGSKYDDTINFYMADGEYYTEVDQIYAIKVSPIS